jgi:hypothetical protein
MSRMAHSTPRARRLSKAGVPLWLAALALAGCFASYDATVADTSAKLLGKSESELRDCLGVPIEFDTRGDEELMTFRLNEYDRRPRFTPGGGIVMGADPNGIHDPNDAERQPFCQLEFVLGKGGVTQVTAMGRDEVGLRANGECLLRARRCVDPSYKDPADD